MVELLARGSVGAPRIRWLSTVEVVATRLVGAAGRLGARGLWSMNATRTERADGRPPNRLGSVAASSATADAPPTAGISGRRDTASRRICQYAEYWLMISSSVRSRAGRKRASSGEVRGRRPLRASDR